MKHIVLAIGLLIFTSSLFAIEIEGQSFYSKVLQKEIKYGIVIPDNYFTSKQHYPVLYMLHGLGDNPFSWLEYGSIAQLSKQMVNNNEISPMILVTPDGFSDYYSNFYSGDYNYQTMFVKEFVPLVDSLYRTVANAKNRAVTGYSMGGFGALMLPINHPDIFSISIPLSASIRTHEQYMTEQSQGNWDKQWGRIFGGVGTSGKARLTNHYLNNSPFGIIASKPVEELNRIRFFIDNGDEEGTLCRSNEELHQLLLDRGVDHTYRVHSGGHDFKFWRKALPDVYRFADAQFHQKPFYPKVTNTFPKINRKQSVYCETYECLDTELPIYYPFNDNYSKRKFSIVYILGSGNKTTEMHIAQYYTDSYEKGLLPAMALCFVPHKLESNLLSEVIPFLEKNADIRDNRRYRSLWQIDGNADAMLAQVLKPQLFTAAAFTNCRFGSKADIESLVLNHQATNNNLQLFLYTPSANNSTYSGNGYLHVALRENDFKHEYRAMPLETDQLSVISDIFLFISERIHH
jgi:enterochelin esterase-like enzyme